MKFLYKGILVASLAVCITSATVLANEAENVPPVQENISFNYQTNVFDIDAGSTQAEQELTVMLVKGDFSEQDVSLSEIAVEDVYYVGQKNGTDYDVFNELGVKYDSAKFEPGVYTLITSGETVQVTKTKLVIGNALGKDGLGDYLPADLKTGNYEFGSISSTERYYPDGVGEKYIYVCYADFPAMTNLDEAGFVFQNISKQGKIMHLYKPLKGFKLNDALAGINSSNTPIQIGVQVNDIPAEGDNAVDNIVAIPYVKN